MAGGPGARGGGRSPTPSALGPGHPAAGEGQDDAPHPRRVPEPGETRDAPEHVARTKGGVAAVGGLTHPGWPASPFAAGVGPFPVLECTDGGVGSGASCPAAKRARSQPRAGTAMEVAHRERAPRDLGGRDGIFGLARVEASAGGRGRSRLHATTVAPRRACPRTRHPHGEPSTRARADPGVGREWALGST